VDLSLDVDRRTSLALFLSSPSFFLDCAQEGEVVAGSWRFDLDLLYGLWTLVCLCIELCNSPPVRFFWGALTCQTPNGRLAHSRDLWSESFSPWTSPDVLAVLHWKSLSSRIEPVFSSNKRDFFPSGLITFSGRLFSCIFGGLLFLFSRR